MIVVAAIAGSLVLLVVALVVAYMAIHNTLRKVLKALNPAWLWFTGLPIGDGKSRTNATWRKRSHGPKPVLHESGHAGWFHHQMRWTRTGIRTGGSVMLLAILAGLILATQITLILLAVLFTSGLGLGGWLAVRWARGWRHQRHYVRPLEGTLARKIPIAPSSITIRRDGDAVKTVDIVWPAETEIDTGDQQAVLSAVTARLAIEAPNASWKLKGRDRSVRLTPCDQPPPKDVSWEDVEAAVMSAAANALVFGIGMKGAIIKATYGEAAHLAIPGISGGGKSNLAAFLLLQELRRGSLIFNLDPKWHSHLWMKGLPNVINAHKTPHLHLALAWLGQELDRRNQAAYASAGDTGRVQGSVGPRIVVVCEELNFGMPNLKNYWKENRTKEDPKKSPALQGLSDLSCAGRAADMHEFLIAQMLTAESTGTSDSTIRGNAGIKAMINPDGPGWNMVVGKHIPLPPQTTIPGRLQLVTGQMVRVTQVPYLHLDDKDEAVGKRAVQWARELATSGVIAQIPTGPEGVPEELWPASVAAAVASGNGAATGVLGSDGFSLPAGQAPETAPRKDMPELISLRQACAEGVLKLGDRDPLGAARKAAQRDGFPKIAGRDGPTALYYRAELVEWQESKIRILRVVS